MRDGLYESPTSVSEPVQTSGVQPPPSPRPELMQQVSSPYLSESAHVISLQNPTASVRPYESSYSLVSPNSGITEREPTPVPSPVSSSASPLPTPRDSGPGTPRPSHQGLYTRTLKGLESKWRKVHKSVGYVPPFLITHFTEREIGATS